MISHKCTRVTERSRQGFCSVKSGMLQCNVVWPWHHHHWFRESSSLRVLYRVYYRQYPFVIFLWASAQYFKLVRLLGMRRNAVSFLFCRLSCFALRLRNQIAIAWGSQSPSDQDDAHPPAAIMKKYGDAFYVMTGAWLHKSRVITIRSLPQNSCM